MKLIKIVKLKDVFFQENGDLVESLHHGTGGDVAAGKTRGYGVVTIRLEGGLLFDSPFPLQNMSDPSVLRHTGRISLHQTYSHIEILA